MKIPISVYLIHAFTALGAVLGLFSLYAIYLHDFRSVFWYMLAIIAVDGLDGTLARKFEINKFPNPLDGALLDNIIDYLTYVIVPAFFILVSNLITSPAKFIAATAIVLSSAYQFTQKDAKTTDHFFKGFPSYWNIVILYLGLEHLSSFINFLIIASLTVLVFVPIKYIYPSRYKNKLFLALTIIWGLLLIPLIASYPNANPLLLTLSLMYCLFYALKSLSHHA